MSELDNQSQIGNLLDNKWIEMKKQNPGLANLVIELIDGGEEKTLDYYAGVNRTLLKIGAIFPQLETFKEYGAYALMLAYSEHQIRNT